MKHFLKSWSIMITAFILLVGTVSYVGCVKYIDTQGREVVRLSDESVDVLDKGAELAPVVEQGLRVATVAFPALAGVFALLSTGLGAFFAAYKKYKPQLVAEHSKAVMYGNSTKALVFAIEEFKESNSEEWENLKQDLLFELKDKVGTEYFAIIDALRDEYAAKNK
jgi:hypothetical protein